MKSLINMVVVLSLLCGISAFALSYLKMTTATSIEEQVLTYVQSPALSRVYPYMDNNPVAERQNFKIEGQEEELMVFPIKEKGKLVGVAIENFGKGYGGDIGVMVAFNVENDTLLGIGITTMKETPGLGTRVADTSFTNKFIKKDSKKIALSSQGGTIDALAGATISSGGTILAIQKASKDYFALKEQILSAWQ